MIEKKAYPNFEEEQNHPAPRNLERWMAAARNIYSGMKLGHDKEKCIVGNTAGWDRAEVRDFKNWLHYYEERSHVKYKTAQRHQYVENPSLPGYFVPSIKINDLRDPVVPINDHVERQQAEDSKKKSEEEQRQLIEWQRKKIIGRLQSARKLLTDDKGKLVAGPGWEKLIDALNELEKQFHTVNKSASNRIYGDLIIRQANRFIRAGNDDSASFLMKLAQGLPGTALPVDPTASVPQGGALLNNTPDVGQKKPGIEVVLDAFNGDLGQNDTEEKIEKEIDEKNDSDDLDHDDLDDPFGLADFEDEDSEEDHDVDFPIDVKAEQEGELVVTAQAAPGELAPAPVKAPPVAEDALKTAPVPKKAPEALPTPDSKEPDLEVVDQGDVATAPGLPGSPASSGQNFDALVDAAFANLKVGDVVAKLEQLSRIFKNREIARQLSLVDMMMDKLGLSSFFPTLAEATRSALESNQYCLTRIDEVKNKLSGAIDTVGTSVHDMGETHSITNQPTETIDLEGVNSTAPKDGMLDKVRDNLSDTIQKEKLKKEIRKKQDEKDLLGKDEPKVEGIGEDLASPVPAPATPSAPAAKPPVA